MRQMLSDTIKELLEKVPDVIAVGILSAGGYITHCVSREPMPEDTWLYLILLLIWLRLVKIDWGYEKRLAKFQ